MKHVPCAEAVTFHSTGSEATFFALRLARAFRRRDTILKFEGGYHGMGDHALMSTQWTQQPAPFPEAVPGSSGIPASCGPSHARPSSREQSRRPPSIADSFAGQ